MALPPARLVLSAPPIVALDTAATELRRRLGDLARHDAAAAHTAFIAAHAARLRDQGNGSTEIGRAVGLSRRVAMRLRDAATG